MEWMWLPICIGIGVATFTGTGPVPLFKGFVSAASSISMGLR